MPLESLPDEVLIEVIGWASAPCHLRSKIDTRTLCQLALCSRRLHKLATYILYKTVEIITSRHLITFLRFVLRKPHVAKLVKTLALHEVSDSGRATRHRLKLSNWTTADFQECRSNIETITSSPSELSYWLDEILQGSWDSLASLVLLCLPNLTQLKTSSIGLASCLQRFHWVLQEAARKQTIEGSNIFSHLSTVHLDCYNGRARAHGQRMEAFSRIPSVKKLRIDYLHDDWFPYYNPEPFQVTDLALYNCCVGSDGLEEFIGYFPSLQRLHIGDSGNTTATPFLYREMLQHLRPSLTALCLHNPSSVECLSLTHFVPASLVDFTSLQTLTIDVHTLLCHGFDGCGLPYGGEYASKVQLADLLPKSLQHLSLRQCDWRIMRHIEGLAEVEFENLPVLKMVLVCVRANVRIDNKVFEVDIPKIWTTAAIERSKQAKSRFEACGVDISFVPDHYWDSLSYFGRSA